MAKLHAITPRGSTVLYDAIMAAAVQIQAIKAVTDEAIKEARESGEGQGVNFKFVNIVLTDGEDTGSEHNLPQCQKFMAVMDRVFSDSPGHTFLIGIGSSNFGALQRIAAVSKSVEYMTCRNESAIKDIFDRIEICVGIRQRTAILAARDQEGNAVGLVARQRQVQLGVSVNRFVVILTIDRSGSMSGYRWKQTLVSVIECIQHLTEHDLFGVQVFSSDLDWIGLPR